MKEQRRSKEEAKKIIDREEIFIAKRNLKLRRLTVTHPVFPRATSV
jgi:hypothetical protein